MDGCASSLFSSVDYQNLNSDFWQLWQQYQDYLHRCCVKWMGNAIDAEDVLSRAMLKAWEKLRNSTVEIRNFKSWVTKLTYNLCVDIHRERLRGGKQVESLDAIDFAYQEEIASQEENPVLVATQQELANFFCLAIDELPLKLRETFILHFQEELSYKEIAEKLNISCENVRKRISQVRKILQQRYNQEFLGEDQSKSGVVSQCELSNNSHPVEQIEVNHIEIAQTEDLELFNLELSNLELSAQETLLNQIHINNDEQCYIKSEDVDQNCPGLTQNRTKVGVIHELPLCNKHLLSAILPNLYCHVNVNVLPLIKVLDDWEIGKNRLSNFGEWLNFQVMQTLHLKSINAIWRTFADSGGEDPRLPFSSFLSIITNVQKSVFWMIFGCLDY